ncbi:hypothetical protein U1Q18_006657 [Sarracenia purpurea var. burkii]
MGPERVVAEKVVGIDLGTTNSTVAAMEGGKPVIVTNSEGQRTTPSVVAYTKVEDLLVGQMAKRQAIINSENTFFSMKRFFDRKMLEGAVPERKLSGNDFDRRLDQRPRMTDDREAINGTEFAGNIDGDEEKVNICW